MAQPTVRIRQPDDSDRRAPSMAELREQQSEAAEDARKAADAVPEEELTPRELAIPVSYPVRDSKTGDVTIRRASIISRAPDGAMHREMEQLEAMARGGLAAASFHGAAIARHASVARCLVQVVKSPAWFKDAVDDDPAFAFEVSEVLVIHEQRFRAAMGVAGGGTPRRFTVESPFGAPAGREGEPRPGEAG